MILQMRNFTRCCQFHLRPNQHWLPHLPRTNNPLRQSKQTNPINRPAPSSSPFTSSTFRRAQKSPAQPDRSPAVLDELPKFGKKKPRAPQGGKALLKRAAAAVTAKPHGQGGGKSEASTAPSPSSPSSSSTSSVSSAPTNSSQSVTSTVHSRTIKSTAAATTASSQPQKTRLVTAYNTADKYDLPRCARLLRAQGYIPDPFTTGLLDDVIHLRISLGSPSTTTIPPAGPASIGPDTPYQEGVEKGDIFIFPSGNIVSWDVPEGQISSLARGLVAASEGPVEKEEDVEREDFEWVEVWGGRVGGSLRGEVVYVGMGDGGEVVHNPGLEENASSGMDAKLVQSEGENNNNRQEQHDKQKNIIPTSATTTHPTLPRITVDPAETLPVILIKLAFSSGLARSTKLAHLESLLSSYLQSISLIPSHLSSPPSLPFFPASLTTRTPHLPYTRGFILIKIGQLLLLRSKLNLYSELTDPLPDLFWDTKHELGLERAYEEVGRALDVERRIVLANERMGYASEVIGTLREALSERHGLMLEWMIIVLIAVEVGFEVGRLLRERREREGKNKEEKNEGIEEDEGVKGNGGIGFGHADTGVTETGRTIRQGLQKDEQGAKEKPASTETKRDLIEIDEQSLVVNRIKRELNDIVYRQGELFRQLERIESAGTTTSATSFVPKLEEGFATTLPEQPGNILTPAPPLIASSSSLSSGKEDSSEVGESKAGEVAAAGNENGGGQ